MSFPFRGFTADSGPGSTHCRGFTITLRHKTLGRNTPLHAFAYSGFSIQFLDTQ